MTSTHSYDLLVAILFLSPISPFLVPAHATPPYAAGVSIGQWASYAPVAVTYHGTGAYSSEPQSIKDLNATILTTATVQQVSSTHVTLQSVTHYKNSTTQAATRYGDLVTGIGNLTFGLLAGGLSAGDRLWVGTYTPTINQTLSLTYLGVSRPVNIFNTTYRVPLGPDYETVGLEFVWDQETGIVLESKNLTIYPASTIGDGFVEYLDVRIQSTNIFSNPSSPDFTITASSPAPVTSFTFATSTITVGSVNGFSGPVTLTVIVPSGLTCNPISPNPITGHGTASLSCRTTIIGSHLVTVIAANGPTTHNATATITVTASPTQTPNAPQPTPSLDTIIGLVILAVAATGAFMFLRTRPEEEPPPTTATT